MANEKMTTDEALALFDRLDIVPMEMMIGSWHGEGIDTGHKMDGMLEAARWHGKIFKDAETVFPLVHKGPFGGICTLNPALLPIGLSMALPFRNVLIPALFPLALPFITTRVSGARLRMTECRGKVSATMCYDAKPIHDVFRKIDDNTVLGLMDRKGMTPPYFFKLMREETV